MCLELLWFSFDHILCQVNHSSVEIVASKNCKTFLSKNTSTFNQGPLLLDGLLGAKMMSLLKSKDFFKSSFGVDVNTDRNFVVISSQQVLHFDLEVKHNEEHFSKSHFYILVIRFAHSK